MNFDYTPKVQELRQKLAAFMKAHVYPNEPKWQAHVRSERRWEPVPVIEELKEKARAEGLWNLWRPKSHGGTLSNLEYAPLCEIMGRVHWAPEVFNCSAPDTGNIETLLKYGTPQQVKQ
ncbi:MAG TPA: acyl-CoA dehydrogenase family protein, partial [Burkholderiales bacterium]|nr:acyl-CoA dehydrogenase family protein [Burkholderiales bacterium]